jgi:TolB-like protein/DNA-binding winged helix-turn-helix (wHTH) protein/Flp pilus assembly protein TadD
MAPANRAAFRVGAWRVNPALDEISQEGRVVKLEPRLMGLLLSLAEHPGEVVSHQKLLDEVWHDVIVSPDSVYQAVGALRRILGDGTKEPTYIANVPRRGYRLVATVTPLNDPAPVILDLSPAQAVTQAPASEAASPTPTRIRWWLIAMPIALAVAGLYLVVERGWLSPHTGAPVVTAGASVPQTDKSIAVLPFLDMSEGKDQEYFADGMAEEIIDRLANVSDLRVAARTSSFYFKNKAVQVPKIARELGVLYVLEGSVRRSADHLRITAQLVRADTGLHLWSDTYDGDLRDVFKVQDDIANAVVQALQIRLMGGAVSRRSGGTSNLQAYQLYLRGRAQVDVTSTAAVRRAQGYFEQATRLDPNFGNAWAWLAVATDIFTDIGIVEPAIGYETARQQAQHALDLSPDVFYAHVALMYLYRTYDRNWSAAQGELDEMRRLEPANADLPLFQGILDWTLGRWAPAESELRTAINGSPLFPDTYFNLGIALYGAKRFPEAETAFRKTLKLSPAFIFGNGYLAKSLLAQDNIDAALSVSEFEKNEEGRLAYLPLILQAAGRQSEADAAFKTLRDKFANSNSYDIAIIYAYRGDRDLAMQWLERAYTQHDPELPELLCEYFLKNLVLDPRFTAFKRKMNLPE